MIHNIFVMQEHGLYYDGNTGCYYKYNQDENKFEFYSQAYATETSHSTQVTKYSRKSIFLFLKNIASFLCLFHSGLYK